MSNQELEEGFIQEEESDLEPDNTNVITEQKPHAN